MIEIFYYFNIFSCFTVGLALLLIHTSPKLTNKHYRNAKAFLGVASLIVALGNAFIIFSGVLKEQVETLSAPVLVVSQLQAALFTFLVLIFLHSSNVNEKIILINIVPTIIFISLYIISAIVLCDVNTYTISDHFANISNVPLLLRTIYGLVYFVQIILYVRLFRRESKIYRTKIENYFSDTDVYNLGWATRLFYQATGIGLTVFIFSIFPSKIFDAVLTVIITYLYFNFAVRYLNHQYRLYYMLPAVDSGPIYEHEIQKLQTPDKFLDESLSFLDLYLKQGVTLADYADTLKITERKLSTYITQITIKVLKDGSMSDE